MAPVTQYVFAEMRRKSEQCTAGSHEWLPYSWIWAFLIILKGCRNCQLSIVNCQFGEAVQTPICLSKGKSGIGQYSLTTALTTPMISAWVPSMGA